MFSDQFSAGSVSASRRNLIDREEAPGTKYFMKRNRIENSLMAAFLIIAFNCSSAPKKEYTPEQLNNKNSLDMKRKRYLPKGYRLAAPEKLSWTMKGFRLDIYAEKFIQGSAVLVEVIPDKDPADKISISFKNSDVLLSRTSTGYRGLFAINPETEPGIEKLTLAYRFKGKKYSEIKEIAVRSANFPVKERALNLGEYSDVATQRHPKIVAMIRSAKLKKNRAFSSESPDMFSEYFSHPRDLHFITSPFWAKRNYQRYKIVKGKKVIKSVGSNIHRGVDLRGVEGAPVYTMARGKVVLAEPLYYEGNFIVVDHGNKIFTYYMHMSEIKVETGEIVEAGKLIGLSGSTGISTAAHLHVSLSIRGVQAHPLSILALPVKD
jgi:murein DD-endopeptidase MepM/ murein hydrolase activator NlpD